MFRWMRLHKFIPALLDVGYAYRIGAPKTVLEFHEAPERQIYENELWARPLEFVRAPVPVVATSAHASVMALYQTEARSVNQTQAMGTGGLKAPRVNDEYRKGKIT